MKSCSHDGQVNFFVFIQNNLSRYRGNVLSFLFLSLHDFCFVSLLLRFYSSRHSVMSLCLPRSYLHEHLCYASVKKSKQE